MSKTISEFKGEAGTIYIERIDVISKTDQRVVRSEYEVWFENLSIIGKGNTELQALQDAALCAAQISLLVATAISKVSDTTPAASGE